MLVMHIAVADFEAVRLANGRSLIHNISVVTGYLDHVKKWKSYGTGYSPVYINTTIKSEGPRIDIRIKNSLKNPAIELSENIQEKLRGTSTLAERLGFVEVEVTTLRQALRLMLDFIHENSDGILMSHALDRDLEFLVDTAKVLGERKIFKKDFLFRPEVGCYMSGWDKLTLVCTQRLLTTLCPKFDKEVSKTQPDSRLSSYASFVYGTDYTQTHTSTGDAYDLYRVLCKAYEMDKFKVDLGKSRLFMKPSSIRTRGYTSSSFLQ
jgi:hypothetical protein